MLKTAALLAAALAVAPAPAARSTPDFVLHATGGVTLTASGRAEFGVVASEGTAHFSLSLGGEYGNGAVVLSRAGGETPMAGTYAIAGWEARGTALGADTFQALFVAGTPAQPEGVFRGYAGSVRITDTRPGRLSGTFTIKARGFRAARPERDGIEVVVHGTFTAFGETTVATVSAIEPAAGR